MSASTLKVVLHPVRMKMIPIVYKREKVDRAAAGYCMAERHVTDEDSASLLGKWVPLLWRRRKTSRHRIGK